MRLDLSFENKVQEKRESCFFEIVYIRLLKLLYYLELLKIRMNEIVGGIYLYIYIYIFLYSIL